MLSNAEIRKRMKAGCGNKRESNPTVQSSSISAAQSSSISDVTSESEVSFLSSESLVKQNIVSAESSILPEYVKSLITPRPSIQRETRPLATIDLSPIDDEEDVRRGDEFMIPSNLISKKKCDPSTIYVSTQLTIPNINIISHFSRYVNFSINFTNWNSSTTNDIILSIDGKKISKIVIFTNMEGNVEVITDSLDKEYTLKIKNVDINIENGTIKAEMTIVC